MARPCAEDSAGSPKPSPPTAPPPPRAPISATLIGASPISRPIASPMRRSRRMRAEEARPRTRRSTATICASRWERRWKIGASTRSRGRFYERGNALKRAESKYQPEIIESNTEADRGLHADFFAARAGSGYRTPDPIFIVGLPRRVRRCSSRSSHRTRGWRGPRSSPISSAWSLRDAGPRARPNIRVILRRLADLPADAFARLGEQYLATRASIARASRFSSTRCRTISAISGLSI